jgi:hypothetical protein
MIFDCGRLAIFGPISDSISLLPTVSLFRRCSRPRSAKDETGRRCSRAVLSAKRGAPIALPCREQGKPLAQPHENWLSRCRRPTLYKPLEPRTAYKIPYSRLRTVLEPFRCILRCFQPRIGSSGTFYPAPVEHPPGRPRYLAERSADDWQLS